MDLALSVGRYGIEEWLGSGATADVFRAYDRALDRLVAIKILRRDLAKGSASEAWQGRFRERARAAARLFHSHIPAIFELAEDHGVPFVAVEYVGGERLDRLVETSGRFTPDRAAAVILQVLDALQYAHESGVVHLALEPSVVFVASGDQVKVANFGFTLANVAARTDVSECAAVTPGIAPEQLTGGVIDHRTDLFTAGALLFEMLTGSKPFGAGRAKELVAQIATLGPEDVRTLDPAMPTALRNIVGRALAYDPDQRFATASEFSHALRAAVCTGDGMAAGTGWPEGRSLNHYAKYGMEASHGGLRPRKSLNHPVAQESHATGLVDSADLNAIETELTRYVGPIAKLLLRQELRNFQTLPKLCYRLASYITNEAERTAFLDFWTTGPI